MRRALFLVVLLGCGSDSSATTPTTPTTPPPQMARQLTPRDKLPKVVLPLLPRHGIYAAGGGLVSSAWRVVVDRDAKTIYAGSSQGANAPSFGKLDKEVTKPLSQRNDAHLMELAEAAWRERPGRPTNATADYDEILIVADGDEYFFLEGYGPIQSPAAAKVIEELRAAAGL